MTRRQTRLIDKGENNAWKDRTTGAGAAFKRLAGDFSRSGGLGGRGFRWLQGATEEDRLASGLGQIVAAVVVADADGFGANFEIQIRHC